MTILTLHGPSPRLQGVFDQLGPVSGLLPGLEAGQLLLSCEAFQYSVGTALYSDPQPHTGHEGCGHASSEKPMAHLCGSSLLCCPFIVTYIVDLRFFYSYQTNNHCSS